MMSLTFGLFTQVSGSGPLGPLVIFYIIYYFFFFCFVFYIPLLNDRLNISEILLKGS